MTGRAAAAAAAPRAAPESQPQTPRAPPPRRPKQPQVKRYWPEDAAKNKGNPWFNAVVTDYDPVQK
jgi:hypothetical protein